ncbi:hypothetical protein EPUS_04895 [Endocarpon pusillum Z07020]|uniref:RBR-type E3 ubiquitin transferase n=1 Tax=Endocarpon pusillum (strain Z07020 / HMAS-L-300199) TaxID=1263415 RepID=U1GRW5_ENDPU|nr:uncharacterized protein EPUS_04895 [Endocarpon pusillum Z07020]ERF74726.1 hypothetical protein EPUS_04895 [Endocarpon pusillum Z07020]
MDIGRRKASSSSSTGNEHDPSSVGNEHDTSSTGDTASPHFQHLVQLINSSTARKQAASVPQAARVASDGENGGHAGPSKKHQTFRLGTGQHEIAGNVGLYQEHPGLDRSAQKQSTDFPTGHGKQWEDFSSSQQSKDNHNEALLTTASCDEMVALKLAQYRPEAQEIQFACTICLETLPLQAFPAVPITSACLPEFHRAADESFVCKSCINESISVQISTSRPDEINCPSCSQRMNHQDIKLWAEHEIFERYDHMITLQALQEDGSFIRCWRPECDTGQFHDGDAASPIVICQACRAMTCYRHSGLPWHEGLTCDQFEDPHTAITLLKEFISELELVSRASKTTLSDEQSRIKSGDAEIQSKIGIARLLLSERQAFLASESDERGAKFVAQTTKPCPRCKAPVEKTGGCKHIKCRCGFEFCYGCLAEWSTEHLSTPCSDEHDDPHILRLAMRDYGHDVPAAANHIPAVRQARMARALPPPFIEGGIAFIHPPEARRPAFPEVRVLRPEARQPQGPRLQTPRPYAPRPEVPPLQLPRPQAPRPGAPRPGAPRPQAPRPQAPRLEAPRPQIPRLEVPRPEVMNRVNLPTHGDVGRPRLFASRPTAQGPMFRDPQGFVRPRAPYPHRDERPFQFPGLQGPQGGVPRSPMSIAADINRSRSDLSLHSGSADRSRFTPAIEEGLIGTGSQRNNVANIAMQRAGLPRGLGDPLFRDRMGRAPPDFFHDNQMPHLARQDVLEGRATRLPPVGTPRAANQDFTMGYQGLQDPFGPDFGRPPLRRNNSGFTRAQEQNDFAANFGRSQLHRNNVGFTRDQEQNGFAADFYGDSTGWV